MELPNDLKDYSGERDSFQIFTPDECVGIAAAVLGGYAMLRALHSLIAWMFA